MTRHRPVLRYPAWILSGLLCIALNKVVLCPEPAWASTAFSDGSCDLGPTPTPIGPALTWDKSVNAFGGEVLELNRETAGEIGGLLCGFSLNPETRVCALVTSTEEPGEFKPITLEFYSEETFLNALKGTGSIDNYPPLLRIKSDTEQSHIWRNAMRLEDVTEDGCADLVLGLESDDQYANKLLALYAIPGQCNEALRVNRGLERVSPLNECPFQTPDGMQHSLNDVLADCAGVQLVLPLYKSSNDATLDWDTLRLPDTPIAINQTLIVAPTDSSVCLKGVGIYPFQTVESFTSKQTGPQPLLCIQEDSSQDNNDGLKQPTARVITTDGELQGLLLIHVGSSSQIIFIPRAVLEDAISQGIPSLYLESCMECARQTIPGDEDVNQLLIIPAETKGLSDTVFTFFSKFTSEQYLNWGTLSLGDTPNLTIRRLTLLDGYEPALSIASEDIDGDGYRELWFSPASLLPNEASTAISASHGMGLLSSKMLFGLLQPGQEPCIEISSQEEPRIGLSLEVNEERGASDDATPFLHSSGIIEGPVPTAYELLAYGNEDEHSVRYYLWTGLSRLFDHDGDTYISSSVPLQTAPWSNCGAAPSPYAANDCDDTNADAAPGNDERCDTDANEDCLGSGRVGCDADGDGFGRCLDCDDSTPGDTFLVTTKGDSSEQYQFWCGAPACSVQPHGPASLVSDAPAAQTPVSYVPASQAPASHAPATLILGIALIRFCRQAQQKRRK